MKKNLYKIIIILTIITVGQSAWSQIASGIYGMKKLKSVDNKTIIDYSKKYNIPLTESYVLENTYADFLSSFDTTKFKEQVKNHYQPLQALYYDKDGQLKSFQINCYAGGFPNLDWNRNGIMTKFPPKQQAPLDNILPLDSLLNYLKPLSPTKRTLNKKVDFTVVTFWSIFMGRQSKRFIHVVQENARLKGNKKIRMIYVNTDNFFISRNE